MKNKLELKSTLEYFKSRLHLELIELEKAITTDPDMMKEAAKDLRVIGLGAFGTGFIDFISGKLINLTKIEAFTVMLFGALLVLSGMRIFNIALKEQKVSKLKKGANHE